MQSISTPLFIFLTLFGLLFSNCSSSKGLRVDKTASSPFPLMVGSFSSLKQAQADSSFYAISLHMYPIWEGKKGQWLYVEQAMESRQDAPYRQRIYKIEQVSEKLFKSRVYRLKEESNFIGKWKEPSFFESMDESILEERDGCAVFLELQADGSFRGATQGKDCSSSLRGASYATSKVEIEKGRITSWDQGFDKNDQQVWGALKGGYVFDKLKKN